MISYDDALAKMLAAVTPLSSETVPLEYAAGRILAEPVAAALDAPRNDVSSMDGYALRHDDAREGDWLEIIGEAAAGAPFTGKLTKGQAVRIFTGAHLPEGADCVVMQEEAIRADARVRIADSFGPARHIRRQGSDFRRGDVLFQAGAFLSPGAVVALAGADRGEVCVSRAPLLSLVATGDELAAPGEAAQMPHTIPDSGSIGVAAMASNHGASVVGTFRGKDSLEELDDLAAQAMVLSDLVVVIGGASVGDRDFAKPMFDRFDLALHFSKVAIKPGKPVWFGAAGKKFVLGLPGNPGSAMVTARLFLVPLLAALQGGAATASITTSPQRLALDLPPSGDRETFVRAQMGEDGLRAVGNQESGAQAPLAASDWLIRRKPGDGARAAGDTVRALLF